MKEDPEITLALLNRSGSQTYGPLRIDWNRSFDEFSVQVRLFLSGQLVDIGTLTRQQPNMPFNVKQGNESAAGTLTGQFATAGQAQLLRGDFRWCIDEACDSFNGIVVSFSG